MIKVLVVDDHDLVRTGIARMLDEVEGKIRGKIWIRGKHQAVVVITYNAETFNITYAASTNLRYNPADNTIHANYNSWIRKLEKAIKGRVAN